MSIIKPVSVQALSWEINEKMMLVNKTPVIRGVVENTSQSNSYIKLYFNLTDSWASVRCYVPKSRAHLIPLIVNHSNIIIHTNFRLRPPYPTFERSAEDSIRWPSSIQQV